MFVFPKEEVKSYIHLEVSLSRSVAVIHFRNCTGKSIGYSYAKQLIDANWPEMNTTNGCIPLSELGDFIAA